MGIYAGLLITALVIGYLAVRISQSRITGNDPDHKEVDSQVDWREPHRNRQKSTTGVGSKSKSTAKTIRGSARMAGTNQKPWGW